MSYSRSKQQSKTFTLNHFIVKQQIGTGRFGLVYRVIQKQSQKEFALKIIIKKTINTKELHKQLQRQVEIQSKLKHDFICQLYACFQDANSVYMILEYCSGGSLSVPIKDTRNVFSYKKIASILKQLLHALAYMHERNVMHRDIKLENILFNKDYDVKISDFGWAVHNPGCRKTFCGTMEYITPQMLNKQKYCHNIDMYCLGVVLYEMFYFKSPYFAQTQQETFENIKKGQVVFDDSIRVVPIQAKTLILDLLSKIPQKRPEAKTLFNHDFIRLYLEEELGQLSNKERFTQQQMQKFKEELKKSQGRSQARQKQITEQENIQVCNSL